ncbi:MAG: hypothetical protein ABSD75_30140 [Terriglobales bacterium]
MSKPCGTTNKLLADPTVTAQIRRRLPTLPLLQDGNNLLFAVPRPFAPLSL